MNTKHELERYRIIIEDIDKFTRCVQGIKNYSNYDPFKVIEKLSNLENLEIECKNKIKMKNELAKHIKESKETESYYEDRLNLKYIKLKNLKDLKMSGLSIQDLKN